MAKITVTGDQGECTRQLEAFVRLEVTKLKPKTNHLIMVVEHAVSAFVAGEATVECEIELASGLFTFKVV